MPQNSNNESAANEKQRVFELLGRLTHSLAEAVGKNCEIVLHDFGQPETSIIAIGNNHITGRKVGDTLDVLGFQLLRHPPPGDLLNYATKTKDGRTLRSSSVFLRDQAGAIYGALCFNFDVSALVGLQEWLNAAMPPKQAVVEEQFEQSVDEVLDALIHAALASSGKPAADMTREEKVSVVAQLEMKGAFLIRYSMDQIAETLGVSKYTIYNYLEEIKSANPDVLRRKSD